MKDRLFQTSLIGSMPRGEEILKARRMLRANMISPSQYQDMIYEKTQEVVKMQEDLGVDIITSGEIERDNYVSFISEKLGGVT